MKTEKEPDPVLKIVNENPNIAFYRFLHTMVKMPVGIMNLTQKQYDFAEKYLDWLHDYHPQFVYTLKPDKLWIIKEDRALRALEGEAAQLEDRFLRDKTIKNRQAIVRAFDDMKRGYVAAGEGTDIIKRLMGA